MGRLAPTRRRRRAAPTARTDRELLERRLCDLDVAIEGSPLEEAIARLDDDLRARGLRFRPHFWLSDEWFSPDGVPGIAIPFYLAHPRLRRLEKRQMLEVEGGTREWCLRILRHEAGHAIDTAYRLHRLRRWQRLFGPNSRRYPRTYSPRPQSRNFVLHLEFWYAQSHPAEDFAETFAVWLNPRSDWRRCYRGWPVLAKLKLVDELMRSIRDRPPPVRSRRRVDPLARLRHTLGEHYARKRRRYGMDLPEVYDRDLRRLFAEPGGRRGESAAAFLRRTRVEMRALIARWTGHHQNSIDQVLAAMIGRCRDLGLRRIAPQRQAKQDTMVFLTAQTMLHLHGNRHPVVL